MIADTRFELVMAFANAFTEHHLNRLGISALSNIPNLLFSL